MVMGIGVFTFILTLGGGLWLGLDGFGTANVRVAGWRWTDPSER